MTETETAPESSPAVITGPDIHPAGTHTETVGYVLPFGGRLVLRVVQDRRRPERFSVEHGRDRHVGNRVDVLAWIEQRAQFLADRETRRRAGSTDPADHAEPPSNLPGRDLWLHLCESWVAWCRLGEGRSSAALPDAQRRYANATNAVGIPWIDGPDSRPGITDEQYRGAYRTYQRAWADADASWRYRRDADAAWNRRGQ